MVIFMLMTNFPAGEIYNSSDDKFASKLLHGVIAKKDSSTLVLTLSQQILKKCQIFYAKD
jgi:hypothetical protein